MGDLAEGEEGPALDVVSASSPVVPRAWDSGTVCGVNFRPEAFSKPTVQPSRVHTQAVSPRSTNNNKSSQYSIIGVTRTCVVRVVSLLIPEKG